MNIINDVNFTDIFTEEEIEENFEIINKLNKEFNDIHKLDNIDLIIIMRELQCFYNSLQR